MSTEKIDRVPTGLRSNSEEAKIADVELATTENLGRGRLARLEHMGLESRGTDVILFCLSLTFSE
jgi:phosphoenolpyruvate synthase/pyruvate phosphate dikinase